MTLGMLPIIFSLAQPLPAARQLVIVTATGMDTELGKIAALLNQTKKADDAIGQTVKTHLASGYPSLLSWAVSSPFYWQPCFIRKVLQIALMLASASPLLQFQKPCPSSSPSVWLMAFRRWPSATRLFAKSPLLKPLGTWNVIAPDKLGPLTAESHDSYPFLAFMAKKFKVANTKLSANDTRFFKYLGLANQRTLNC